MAIIVCAAIPLADLFGKQIVGDSYPLTTQQSGLIAILASFIVIIGLSLITRRKEAPGWRDYGPVVRRMDAEEKALLSAERKPS